MELKNKTKTSAQAKQSGNTSIDTENKLIAAKRDQ